MPTIPRVGKNKGNLASAGAVVPSDTVNLPRPSQCLYIGGSGDITVMLANDVSPVLLKNVPIGKLDICVSRVYATGTLATYIVALY